MNNRDVEEWKALGSAVALCSSECLLKLRRLRFNNKRAERAIASERISLRGSLSIVSLGRLQWRAIRGQFRMQQKRLLVCQPNRRNDFVDGGTFQFKRGSLNKHPI